MENIKKKRNVCEISLLVYIQVFGSGYFLFVCIRQMATYITVVGLLFFQQNILGLPKLPLL